MATIAPISVQLYSLREESADDFDSVLRSVADMGYAGVEPFHLFGMTPREFAERINDLGMQISSSHYPWANRAELNEVIDVLGELGLDRAIGGFMPPDFADLDAVRRTADTTLALQEKLRAAGLKLALHNHYWEYAEFGGRPAYHYFQDWVPEVEFEIDTYWAANFGARDPAKEVARVSERTPLIHIKDGPLKQNEPMVALGTGRMDIAGVIQAADGDVLEWCIVELDACATDMSSAIRKSHDYLAALS